MRIALDTTNVKTSGEQQNPATAHGSGRSSGSRLRGGPARLPVVLVVDDVADNLLALEAMLRRDDVEVLTASSGRVALEILLERDIAVAIIDVMMPEMDGFELAELIRGVDRTRHVPIIFVTAGSKAEYRVFTGYKTGAIDFLFKPLDERILRAKVDVLVTLERQQREVERARAEMEVLLRLAQAASQSGKPEDIYDPALDAVRDLFGADRSAILLFDDTDRMRFQAWRGLSESYRAAVDGHSPWSRAESDAAPILIPDVAVDEAMVSYRSIFATERISAIGFVPLISQRRLLGKFMLYWDHARAFSEHDKVLALAIASEIAEALERARLREAERAARLSAEAIAARMAFLAEASAALSKSLDCQASLRNVAELAVPRIADWCVVDVVEQNGSVARVAVAHADATKAELAEALSRLPTDPEHPTAMARVLRGGSPELFTDVTHEMAVERIPDHEALRTMRAIGPGSVMFVPVAAGGRTFGAIGFAVAESGRRYDETDLQVAVELGHRAGLALQNSRLYEEERRARKDAQTAEERSAAIQLISDAALAHLEIDPLLAEMLARVRRIFLCDTATILMLDEARQRVEVRACDGIEREVWDRVAVPYGEGVAGAIVARGEPVVVNDVAADDVVSPYLKERLGSMMGVPLVLEQVVVGVLHVGCFQPRKFAQGDVELLQMVAARAALALDRASTYDALRRAEEKLSIALSAGSMGVWEWSIPTERVTWSPTLEAIHGLGPGTFPGTFEAYQSDIHPDDRDQLLRTIRETLETKRDHHIEYRIILPDGRVRWVAGHGNIVAYADGKPISMMGVCMDITARKQLEQAREAAVAELERTLRENEIFAGVLAHDLRNPLGAILTGAHLVLERHKGEENITKPMSRIVSSGTRMTSMIDQLLDFTRARVGGGIDLEPRDASLADICGQAVGELEVAHPEWRIKVESLGDLRGTWDPDRLLQVVSNLVANAGQHGTSGGAIRLEVDGTDPSSMALEVHNGGSIPEAMLPSLFAPFRGTKDRRSLGLGLGLFITRDIVVGHGGTIEVTSSDAAGTAFKIRLPRHATPRPRAGG
ncbi:MAG: GAF domain-containing protein [Planctomycetes bacterium]|nr:GAF domain-containing protein [Planctomycetota bacterium]